MARVPAVTRRRQVQAKCFRRGPVTAGCPDIVYGTAGDCRHAKRAAIHSVLPRCWNGGASDGHCRCADELKMRTAHEET